jgi:Divergent InlB B-repeat domain
MVSREVAIGSTLVRIVFSLVVLFFLGSALLLSPGVASAAQLSLSWVDNSGGTASFNVERKTGTTGTYAWIVTTTPGVTTYVDSTVTAGTTYCYRVMATNAAGSSGYSNEACGAPAAGSSVTVTMSGSGSGTVTSSPAGISCPGTCSATFSTGTVVTLTATAASGSSFGGWSGGGCAGTAPCVFTGNAPVSVTAPFSLNGHKMRPRRFNSDLRSKTGDPEGSELVILERLGVQFLFGS